MWGHMGLEQSTVFASVLGFGVMLEMNPSKLWPVMREHILHLFGAVVGSVSGIGHWQVVTVDALDSHVCRPTACLREFLTIVLIVGWMVIWLSRLENITFSWLLSVLPDIR